jgi:hypothetical protein
MLPVFEYHTVKTYKGRGAKPRRILSLGSIWTCVTASRSAASPEKNVAWRGGGALSFEYSSKCVNLTTHHKNSLRMGRAVHYCSYRLPGSGA